MTPIKSDLLSRNIRASKGLGQNFLVEKEVIKKILEVGKVEKSDSILEIGPGTGLLTSQLALHARKVIAIEKDKNMAPFLEPIAKKNPSLGLLWGDALSIIPELSDPYNKVIANIPYYITSRLLRVVLELKGKNLDLIVFLVQKEVARRMCEKPPRMNLLAVSVQYYGTPSIARYVSRGSFYPVPKVDSAIVKIVPHSTSLPNEKAFFTIVKAGFSQPRKLLISNLSDKLRIPKDVLLSVFTKTTIPHHARAQTLTLDQWKLITENLPSLHSV
jgi:16S rRNA (adenine1518-N6/adenine1519-N6)-dimethyltransferase